MASGVGAARPALPRAARRCAPLGAQSLFGAPDPGTETDTWPRLQDFLTALVAERRPAPGADLVSELISTPTRDGDPPASHEVHGLLLALLLGGLVPPAQSVALGVTRLLADPAAARALLGMHMLRTLPVTW